MKYVILCLSLCLTASAPSATFAEETNTVPACAQTGASSVFINGKPALKLGDVVNCPPELIEILPGIAIEGQPMVHLRSGAGEKGACGTGGSNDVVVNGTQAQRAGDANCVETE